MLHPTYPNLELLEYKVRQLLSNDEAFCEAIRKEKEKARFVPITFEAIMFAQTWPSTCLGFDVTDDGSPAIAGQAFTSAYTTVFCQNLTGTFVVCFGDKPCYKVTEANAVFYNDLRDRRMASLNEARQRY